MFRTNYVADECEHKVCAADNNQHYRGPTAIARKQIAQIFDLREEFHLIKRRDDKAQERYDRAKGKSHSLPRGNRDYRQNEIDDYRNVGDGDKIRRENNVELCKFVRFEHHVEHIGKVFKADVFSAPAMGYFAANDNPNRIIDSVAMMSIRTPDTRADARFSVFLAATVCCSAADCATVSSSSPADR